jgi:NADPH:quinone reductase-like Zn-dependent oxidoreductase
MRAITQRSLGGPEVLELVDVDRPVPLPTEVLVRVVAAGVNPVEPAVRAGYFPILGTPPFTLGWDISGVVEEVVPGVTRFQPGDEVYGMPFFPRAASAYAEYVIAPSRQLAHKPRRLDHVHAAAVPLAGLTAWQALVDVAAVRPGQRVLVHGAGGGVGHLAVGVAKALGAHVSGTASAAKLDFVRGLGADEVIDHRAVDFTSEVKEIDVVLETVGSDNARRSLHVLRPGGVLVYLPGRPDQSLYAEAAALGVQVVVMSVEPDHHGLTRLAELIDAGVVRPHVSHAVPLEQVARAHELVAAAVPGKVVLTL